MLKCVKTELIPAIYIYSCLIPTLPHRALSRDTLRDCCHQCAQRKSLKCTELLGPFALSISAWIQAWITEVCFSLNNDLKSQTEQGTFLRVTSLNTCPFHRSDRSLILTDCLQRKSCGCVLCAVVHTKN